jgi:hypothetical protein
MIIRLLRDLIELEIGIFGIFVFVLLVLACEVGFWVGRVGARTQMLPERESAVISTLTTGMLGLVAFTLALTIGIAENRFEARRQATLNEANAIGTAWLRVRLAGAPGKPTAGLIEDYARARLVYLEATNPAAAAAALARADTLQNEIWQHLLPLITGMPPTSASALASSLDNMAGSSLVQRYSMESEAPTETLLMLLAGAMLAAGALGYQTGLAGRRQLVLTFLLLVMLSGAMVMILDFNRARGGFIHVDTIPFRWTIEGFVSNPAR